MLVADNHLYLCICISLSFSLSSYLFLCIGSPWDVNMMHTFCSSVLLLAVHAVSYQWLQSAKKRLLILTQWSLLKNRSLIISLMSSQSSQRSQRLKNWRRQWQHLMPKLLMLPHLPVWRLLHRTQIFPLQELLWIWRPPRMQSKIATMRHMVVQQMAMLSIRQMRKQMRKHQVSVPHLQH